MNKSYSVVGVVLLTAYLLQNAYGFKWPWLVEMQINDTYKQISGLLILLFICSQWYLSILRIKNRMAEAFIEIHVHKTLGVLAPVFLYFHSYSMGSHYLFLLSALYVSIFLIGICHPSVFGIRQIWVNTTWIIGHVGMASLLMLLLGQHIFISYWYE